VAPENGDAAITVETDLFEHREAKPHFINPCCFGEDFAGWLKQELQRFPDHGLEYSKLIQEDYGWGFWASRGKDSFWIAVGFVGDLAGESAGVSSREGPAAWGISIAYDPGLNPLKRLFHKPDRQLLERLRTCVLESLAAAPGIRIV